MRGRGCFIEWERERERKREDEGERKRKNDRGSRREGERD